MSGFARREGVAPLGLKDVAAILRKQPQTLKAQLLVVAFAWRAVVLIGKLPGLRLQLSPPVK